VACDGAVGESMSTTGQGIEGIEDNQVENSEYLQCSDHERVCLNFKVIIK
jgi:hypothetical protein